MRFCKKQKNISILGKRKKVWCGSVGERVVVWCGSVGEKKDGVDRNVMKCDK
jgi:phage baseplate assembly protein gpV